jgi:phospholipid/cholesterol/gamma-HCH transport system substrate-binding protein
MNISTEAKVGSVSLIACMLLVYIVIHLSGFTFGDKGYPVQAVFRQVNGIKEGNIVRYAGVDVGRIKEVRVLPQEGVQVTMLMDPGVKIPEGSKFLIGADGLMGEKYINIIPTDHSSSYLLPNAKVKGEEIQGLDELIASSDRVLAEVHDLVKSLNEILGDDKVKAAMKNTILNAQEITDNMNIMMGNLARMTQENGDIDVTVKNLSAMSRSLREAAAKAEIMMQAVDNDGQTARDLQVTLVNIKNTSIRVEKMAAALEGVVTDPETAQNIKETLKNARMASERANKMLTKVSSIDTKVGFETLYNRDTGKYSSNADLKINTSPTDFAIIGVSHIGDGSKGNFQVGKGNEEFAGRAGVIDSKVGVGVDTKIGKQMSLSLDVYDPQDVRVKLRSLYQIAPDTFIVGQSDGINKQDEQTYFGVRRNF